MRKNLLKLLWIGVCLIIYSARLPAQRQMEKLNRGLVAVRTSNSQVFLSWRVFGSDDLSTGFNIYKGSTKLNSSPITGATNYIDNTGTNGTYIVKTVVNGVEQTASDSAVIWSQFYKEIPLKVPTSGVTPAYTVTNSGKTESYPNGQSYTYSPNDCSVGDVDGDGEYEIIVKWDPSNSRDNSQGGYTGNVYLDAYKLNGTFLWRIDLGKNIRAGAHYTQFMLYDLDGDGKAEVACKTAPGTIDGKGHYLTGAASGTNNAADYRTGGGWPGFISSGPEYLTVFNGQTGAEIQTILYEPNRDPANGWGKSSETYNRVDRFLACIAYLDGKKPSLVMCRGYYGRSVLVAYDFKNNQLTKKWAFDSSNGNSGYAGQGNHNLCVGDIDSDGFDEIVYGACAIDHDGTGKYTTGLGHGDAVHMGDFDPDRPGLEVWQAHEGGSGATFRDAKTGAVIWKYSNSGDVGRGMAADVDATNKGIECWASGSGLYSCKGTVASASQPASDNFGIWWDGDDLREILDGTKLDKYGTGRLVTLYNYASASACNGTKNTPNIQADIIGDWREEVILHSSDNTKLLLFTTTIPTTRRLFTLMHDPMYRLGVAWQNVAYNQPPDLSFYMGGGMSAPSYPSIIYPQFITFDSLAPKIYGDTNFDLSATANSNLPVTYTSSNPSVAVVNGATVSVVGAGSTTITASQPGNSSFNPAAGISQVLTVAKASQTINFSDLISQKVGDAPFNLTATSSSGLPVSYTSSNTGVATISGSTVTIIGYGTASITASQPGNENYNAAPDITKELNVINTAVASVTGQDIIIAPNPVSENLKILFSTRNTKAYIEIYSLSGIRLYNQNVMEQEIVIPMSGFLPGPYLVKIILSGKVVLKEIIKL
jgi:rhamnogalacturonan endolyase